MSVAYASWRAPSARAPDEAPVLFSEGILGDLSGDLVVHPDWPLPTPYLARKEVERSLGISAYTLLRTVERMGWQNYLTRIYLGRGRGSPVILPLFLLPALERAGVGRPDDARQLVSRASEFVRDWSALVALLRRAVPAHPRIASAISEGDMTEIALSLSVAPDLLRVARRLASQQWVLLDGNARWVTWAIWKKVDGAGDGDPHVLPLPEVLDSPRTGTTGPVIQVEDAAGRVGLHFRVALPLRALPIEPTRGLRDAGPKAEDATPDRKARRYRPLQARH